MKHTKGEWKAQTDKKGFFWVDSINEDGGESICNIGITEEAEANAKLISAAPDLLEALKNAIEWFKKLDDWSGVGDPDIEKYIAAIKKATQ